VAAGQHPKCSPLQQARWVRIILFWIAQASLPGDTLHSNARGEHALECKAVNEISNYRVLYSRSFRQGRLLPKRPQTRDMIDLQLHKYLLIRFETWMAEGTLLSTVLPSVTQKPHSLVLNSGTSIA